MFQRFPKITRLNREWVVTEKIDGTNAQVHCTFENSEPDFCLHTELTENGPLYLYAGSRNRYLTLENDNFGFAKWVQENGPELARLGPGRHYGEWWGKGIQRGYGLGERRFSLFNVERWADADDLPECCHVVPVVFTGDSAFFTLDAVFYSDLCGFESLAAPGYHNPEGFIFRHTPSGHLYKWTYGGDGHKVGG